MLSFAQHAYVADVDCVDARRIDLWRVGQLATNAANCGKGGYLLSVKTTTKRTGTPTLIFIFSARRVLCFSFLLGHTIYFAVPLTLAKLVRPLAGTSAGSPKPCLFQYIGLRFLQSSGGLFALQDVCVSL